MLTAGTWFAKDWPSDSPVPYEPAVFSLWGLKALWGEEATRQQTQVAAQAFADSAVPEASQSVVPLSVLDCGHTPDAIDWATDLNMKIISAMFLADQEFIYQLCLVDPDLMRPVHGESDVEHRHPRLAPLDFYDIASEPTAIQDKVNSIEAIVMINGDKRKRGWELTDLDHRLAWSTALSEYLQPLWMKDSELCDRKFGGYGGAFSARDVDVRALGYLETVEELEARESALLQFWMHVLQRDHAVVAVPFFESPSRDARGDWKCADCRAQDLFTPGSPCSSSSSVAAASAPGSPMET